MVQLVPLAGVVTLTPMALGELALTSTVFTDEWLGYTIAVPSGWQAANGKLFPGSFDDPTPDTIEISGASGRSSLDVMVDEQVDMAGENWRVQDRSSTSVDGHHAVRLTLERTLRNVPRRTIRLYIQQRDQVVVVAGDSAPDTFAAFEAAFDQTLAGLAFETPPLKSGPQTLKTQDGVFAYPDTWLRDGRYTLRKQQDGLRAMVMLSVDTGDLNQSLTGMREYFALQELAHVVDERPVVLGGKPAHRVTVVNAPGAAGPTVHKLLAAQGDRLLEISLWVDRDAAHVPADLVTEFEAMAASWTWAIRS